MARKRKTKRSREETNYLRDTNYSAFITLGFIFFLIGMLFDNSLIWSLGIIFLAAGLIKKQKERPMGERERVVFQWLIAALLILLLLGIVVMFNLFNVKTLMFGSYIGSFEDCVAAGFPIMESYPRQCKAYGKTFVEELD